MKVLLMTSSLGIGFNNAPPLGLYRLKQSLQAVDIECDILDFSLSSAEEFLKKAAKGEYQVIGMSVSHYHMKEDVEMIWQFRTATKGQKCVLIAGGQEATFNYKNWLRGGVDLIFLGYAERSLALFCQQLRSDFETGITSVEQMDGVAYLKDDRFVFRPIKEITQAEFEYLNYEQMMKLEVPFEPYWDHFRRNSKDFNFWTSIFVAENVRIYAASHCPNKCGFCSSQRFLAFSQQKPARIFMLSARQIFDLIMLYITRDGARGFLFSDDEFLVQKKRVHELCDYIIEAKKTGRMDPDVIFNCQTRIFDFLDRSGSGQVVDFALIDKMLAAGFHSIGVGVETFVDRLLLSPSMNKKGFTEKDTELVLEALLQKKLIPQVNIIIFIPETTPDEILYTIKKILRFIRQGCQVAVTPLLYAVPGSPVAEDSRYPINKEKFVNPDTGETIEIMKNYIPVNAQVAECSTKFFDAMDREVNDFKKANSEKIKALPKTVVGLLMFMTVARLLKADELLNECRDLTQELIDGKSQIGERFIVDVSGVASQFVGNFINLVRWTYARLL